MNTTVRAYLIELTRNKLDPTISHLNIGNVVPL